MILRFFEKALRRESIKRSPSSGIFSVCRCALSPTARRKTPKRQFGSSCGRTRPHFRQYKLSPAKAFPHAQ
jgi:hypothetical protein